MKILLATINYDHPQRGLRRAFDYVFGAPNVAEFDYLAKARQGQTPDQINQELIAAVHADPPDWIWLQLQETNVISPETLLQIKRAHPQTILSHWTGDFRPSVGDYLASICRATDVTFISNVGQLDLFRRAGARVAHYLQIGLDWEEDVLGLPPWQPPFTVPDVVFLGNHYGDYFPEGTAQRLAVIRALQEAKLPIGVVGNGWPSDINVVGSCAVKQQHHVYRRAKVTVNVNHVNDVDRYYSDRQLIAMASGTPVVCWAVPGLDREFRMVGDERDDCLGFTRPETAVECVRRLLAEPDLAQRIGYNGRRAVLTRHDWINRIHEASAVLAVLARVTKGRLG